MRMADYQPRCIYPDIPNIGFDVYEKGLSLFIRLFLEDHKGDVAIYQFGEIKTPGLSDIDLLLVVEDNVWKHSIQKARTIINSSGLLHFLFVHEPVIIGKSLLQSLTILHTFENCKFIQGSFDPINNHVQHRDCNLTSFMRHGVWNSFMRISALGLDNNCIGLRRALILMNNLLKSAKYGNNFLSDPVLIEITSDRIRDEMLSGPIDMCERTAMKFINDIVSALNEVDRRIDNEVRYNGWPFSDSIPLNAVYFCIGHCFVTNANIHIKPNKPLWPRKLFDDILIVRVPKYLINIASILASETHHLIKPLSEFKCSNKSSVIRKTKDNEFAYHLDKVIKICDEHGIYHDTLFPLPFGIHRREVSVKSKFIGKLRRLIMTRYL